MPVQFLPSFISPLYNDAIKEANEIEFEDIHSKIIAIEYLIVLLLTAFRDKDRIRIPRLLDNANKETIELLIEKYDDGHHTLSQRYKSILAFS